MSAIRTNCPSCDAALRTDNLALAGKTIKCPKCAKPFKLPELDDDETDEEEPKRTVTRKTGRKDEISDADKPKSKIKKRPDPSEDDDNDRPRRTNADDANRPGLKKKKKKRQTEARSMTPYLIGGGIVFAILIVVGILFFTGSKDPEGAGTQVVQEKGGPRMLRPK